MAAEKVTGVRGVYIRQEDLNNFGYTANCKKCHSISLYGSAAGAMPHSVACRERIMAKLQETEAGRARVAKMTQRVDRYNTEQDLAAQGAARSSGPQDPVSMDLPTLKPMDVPDVPIDAGHVSGPKTREDASHLSGA